MPEFHSFPLYKNPGTEIWDIDPGEEEAKHHPPAMLHKPSTLKTTRFE
jgi:hypothetical protein